jgi:phosphopantetheinyl transferase
VDQDFHWQRIAHHFLSSVEQRRILESPPESQAETFFRCWTRREAHCKAHGTGLASLECDGCAPDEVKDETGSPWSLLSTTRFSRYAAALCVNSERFNLAYFDWNHTRSAGTTGILQSIECE